MEKNQKTNKFKARAKWEEKKLKKLINELRKLSKHHLNYSYEKRLDSAEDCLKNLENHLKGWAILILHYADKHDVKQRYLISARGLSRDNFITYNGESIDISDEITVINFLSENKHLKAKPYVIAFRRSYLSFYDLRTELSEIKKKLK